MDTDGAEILLCSADRHDEHARLSLANHSFEIVAGDPLRAGLQLSGVFGRMNTGPVAIFRRSGELLLYSPALLLRLTDEFSAQVSHASDTQQSRVLKIASGDSLEVLFRYQAGERWADEFQKSVDFTMTDEEDFDCGLMIANIINDKDRRASFYFDR